MTVYPCAKINLGLNIVNKRSDGYHDLETVFYPIGIYDELTVTENVNTTQKQPCMLQVDGMNIDCDPEKNLVVRAYDMLSRHYNLPHVSVKLTKRIPMQAGMGGGSADGSYMLRALNEMFDLGMQRSEMQYFACKLGADCAFFINPVPSYAEGIGEKLVPISVDLEKYKIVIVKPKVAISTKEAFANIIPVRPECCCRDIINRPVEMWRNVLVNDFERSVALKYPIINDIKQSLYDMGAIYVAMSGSGSSLFSIFSETPERLKETFCNCYTVAVSGYPVL